jgi:hypothetical protein
MTPLFLRVFVSCSTISSAGWIGHGEKRCSVIREQSSALWLSLTAAGPPSNRAGRHDTECNPVFCSARTREGMELRLRIIQVDSPRQLPRDKHLIVPAELLPPNTSMNRAKTSPSAITFVPRSKVRFGAGADSHPQCASQLPSSAQFRALPLGAQSPGTPPRNTIVKPFKVRTWAGAEPRSG